MSSGFVAVVRIDLHFPDSGSLKAKRAELNAVKARLRDRCGASVAEVDHQDTWQRSTLAVAITGGAPARCEEAADRVVRMLDAHFPQGVWTERCIASWSDLESLG